jgi:hypothetical protein
MNDKLLHAIKTENHLGNLVWLLGLLICLFVIFPASLSGIMLAALLVSQYSVRDVASAAYEWADQSVRGAPSGQLFIESCISVDDHEGASSKQPVCSVIQRKLVDVSTYVESMEALAKRCYALLVLTSLVSMIACGRLSITRGQSK